MDNDFIWEDCKGPGLGANLSAFGKSFPDQGGPGHRFIAGRVNKAAIMVFLQRCEEKTLAPINRVVLL